jgi:hypothetical protein
MIILRSGCSGIDLLHFNHLRQNFTSQFSLDMGWSRATGFESIYVFKKRVTINKHGNRIQGMHKFELIRQKNALGLGHSRYSF